MKGHVNLSVRLNKEISVLLFNLDLLIIHIRENQAELREESKHRVSEVIGNSLYEETLQEEIIKFALDFHQVEVTIIVAVHLQCQLLRCRKLIGLIDRYSTDLSIGQREKYRGRKGSFQM